MTLSKYQRGQILIIYLSTLFVGGSTIALGLLSTGKPLDDLVKNVKVRVSDNERQQQVLDLLEQWKDEGKEKQKVYREQREQLLDLVKDHAATRVQFDNQLEQLLAMDTAAAKRLLDIQYGLRENLTETEWNKILAK